MRFGDQKLLQEIIHIWLTRQMMHGNWWRIKRTAEPTPPRKGDVGPAAGIVTLLRKRRYLF